MIYMIYRVDKDGVKQIVNCTEDLCEVGVIIEEDRRNLDWEPGYLVEAEKGAGA